MSSLHSHDHFCDARAFHIAAKPTHEIEAANVRACKRIVMTITSSGRTGWRRRSREKNKGKKKIGEKEEDDKE